MYDPICSITVTLITESLCFAHIMMDSITFIVSSYQYWVLGEQLVVKGAVKAQGCEWL